MHQYFKRVAHTNEYTPLVDIGISLDGMECEHVPDMNKIFIETHSISRKISLDGRSKPSVIHVE